MSHFVSLSVRFCFWRRYMETYGVARLHLLYTLPMLLTTWSCWHPCKKSTIYHFGKIEKSLARKIWNSEIFSYWYFWREWRVPDHQWMHKSIGNIITGDVLNNLMKYVSMLLKLTLRDIFPKVPEQPTPAPQTALDILSILVIKVIQRWQKEDSDTRWWWWHFFIGGSGYIIKNMT